MFLFCRNLCQRKIYLLVSGKYLCEILLLSWPLSCFVVQSHAVGAERWRGEADDELRETDSLSLTSPGWAGDGANGNAMHGAVPGKEAYASHEGGEQAHRQTHIHAHTHTHKYILDPSIIALHKRRGMNPKYANTHTQTDNGQVLTHTLYITYANELQRLHGMWQMPSSPAHILFPELAFSHRAATRAEDEKRPWWKTVFECLSRLFLSLISKCRSLLVIHTCACECVSTDICSIFLLLSRSSRGESTCFSRLLKGI